MASYASYADLTKRYDINLIKELIQDVGDPSLYDETIATAALSDASGWVDSACRQADRYTDLTDLSDNSTALLKRIVCDLAFSFLRQRRGRDVNQFETVKISLEMVDLLRRGERIFDDDVSPDAGNPTTDKITSSDASNANGIVYQCSRFYPVFYTNS